MIQVDLWTDHMGNLHGDPVDELERAEILDGMRENGYPHHEGVPLLFVEGSDNAKQALDSLGVDHRDANYGATFPVDEWTFRHLCGYQSD